MSNSRHSIWIMIACAACVLCGAYGTTDSRTQQLLQTTVLLGATVVTIAVPVGVIAAWLGARTNVPGGPAASAVLNTFLFLPLILHASGWDAGFGRQGWFSLTTESSGGPILSGLPAAIWVHSLAAIPWVAFWIRVALQHADPILEEAAYLDYSAVTTFARVTLPQIKSAIVAAALWIFVVVAGEMTVTDLYQVRTFAEEYYVVVQLAGADASVSEGDMTLPRGTGVLVALCVIGWLAVRIVHTMPMQVALRSPGRFDIGFWRWPATAFVAAIVLLVAAVPLANLIYNAGMMVGVESGQLVRSWSPMKAVGMLVQTPLRFAPEIAWSCVISGVTASVAIAIAVPLAWWSRARTWATGLVAAVVACGLALPGPMIGLLLVRWFNQPECEWRTWLYDHTIAAPVAALTFRALPAAILVAIYGFQTLPAELTEAATVDGLSPFARLTRVGIRLRWKTLLVAWIAAFLIALGDVSTTILVIPPGLFTVSIRIFGLLHAGVDDQVAGLCLTVLLAVIGCQWFLRQLLARES